MKAIIRIRYAERMFAIHLAVLDVPGRMTDVFLFLALVTSTAGADPVTVSPGSLAVSAGSIRGVIGLSFLWDIGILSIMGVTLVNAKSGITYLWDCVHPRVASVTELRNCE